MRILDVGRYNVYFGIWIQQRQLNQKRASRTRIIAFRTKNGGISRVAEKMRMTSILLEIWSVARVYRYMFVHFCDLRRLVEIYIETNTHSIHHILRATTTITTCRRR